MGMKNTRAGGGGADIRRTWLPGIQACEGGPACVVVGMVHLLPLPGSPASRDVSAIVEAAQRDAERLLDGGCDALLVENMGDVPYLKGMVAPETVAAMSLAVDRVVSLGRPTGVQVLAAANRQALGIAVATGASFIRVEGFAYGHLADEGWIDACAGELVRARSQLGSQVAIWADVQKKHAAHAATADLSLADLAQGHGFCGADALVVTGTSTGRPTSPDDLEEASAAGLPLVVGSGVSPRDVVTLATRADALIVGSWFKEGGDWRNPVSVSRVKELIASLRSGP